MPNQTILVENDCQDTVNREATVIDVTIESTVMNTTELMDILSTINFHKAGQLLRTMGGSGRWWLLIPVQYRQPDVPFVFAPVVEKMSQKPMKKRTLETRLNLTKPTEEADETNPEDGSGE